MLRRFAMLFEYEREALLGALRRDLRSEIQKASQCLEDAEFHKANYRSSLKLLEALNPKRVESEQRAAHLAAIAEFDTLWENDKWGSASARMEELLPMVADL